MYISMNSDALLLMNATPLSPATARAISVFPLPASSHSHRIHIRKCQQEAIRS
jgi:hypothetical protein